MKKLLLLLLLTAIATTAQARKPDRTPPSTPVVVDSAGTVIGPLLGLSGPRSGTGAYEPHETSLLVTAPTGEPVHVVWGEGDKFLATGGPMRRVYYPDSQCNSDPYVWATGTEVAAVSAIGRDGGMLYASLSTPTERLAYRSWFNALSGQCGKFASGSWDMRPLVPLPLPFVAPFHVEVR